MDALVIGTRPLGVEQDLGLRPRDGFDVDAHLLTQGLARTGAEVAVDVVTGEAELVLLEALDGLDASPNVTTVQLHRKLRVEHVEQHLQRENGIPRGTLVQVRRKEPA